MAALGAQEQSAAKIHTVPALQGPVAVQTDNLLPRATVRAVELSKEPRSFRTTTQSPDRVQVLPAHRLRAHLNAFPLFHWSSNNATRRFTSSWCSPARTVTRGTNAGTTLCTCKVSSAAVRVRTHRSSASLGLKTKRRGRIIRLRLCISQLNRFFHTYTPGHCSALCTTQLTHRTGSVRSEPLIYIHTGQPQQHFFCNHSPARNLNTSLSP